MNILGTAEITLLILVLIAAADLQLATHYMKILPILLSQYGPEAEREIGANNSDYANFGGTLANSSMMSHNALQKYCKNAAMSPNK